MKAIRLHHVGGPESLVYEDAPKPIPKDNQVLVQVCASGITPTEFVWYPTFHTPEGGERPFPIILGHEFSGVVEAVGTDCMDIRVGDHVYGLSDWFIDGAQAEYCVTIPPNIAPKPATLEHTQAAAIPISALTAWQALIDRARLSAGQRVLILWCSRRRRQFCRANSAASEGACNRNGLGGEYRLCQGARRR